MPRALLVHLCSWALAGAAWAGDPSAALEGRTRVELSISAASRRSVQDSTTRLAYSGVLSPVHARLTAAHFFHPLFGVTADLGLDAFGVEGVGFQGESVSKTLVSAQLSAAALGQWRVMEGLALEGQAGYLLGSLPTLKLVDRRVEVGYASLGGPQLGAQVRWDASGLSPAALGLLPEGLRPAAGPLSAQAGLRWLPAGVGVRTADGGAARAWQVLFDLGLSYRLAGVGPARIAAGLSYELSVARVRYGEVYELEQLSHRFGLSVRGWLAPPGADARGLDRALPPGRIQGLVVRDGNAPIRGARVELPGQAPVVTHSDGSFALEGVPPGPVELTVSAAGFKARAESITVSPGAELKLTVTLAPPGPGKIRGTAFAAPAAQGGERTRLADVTIQGPRGEVRAAPDGTFTLDEVGPGPVQVKASLKGFKPVEEVVSVPAEGEASLELTLVREEARVLASMRGQVRTLRGKPVSAVLKIPEAAISTRTGSDGRFNVRVPGGKYTVVFEAPGYVRQTKTVEVADGDQAIFYVDLSREDR